MYDVSRARSLARAFRRDRSMARRGWGADPEIPREDGETVFTAHFESLVDARALLAENYLSAGAPFDYDPDDAERLEREQAPFRPFPPLWVRFLRVVAAATVVVLIQADWMQRKLRDSPRRRTHHERVTTRLPDHDGRSNTQQHEAGWAAAPSPTVPAAGGRGRRGHCLPTPPQLSVELDELPGHAAALALLLVSAIRELRHKSSIRKGQVN